MMRKKIHPIQGSKRWKFYTVSSRSKKGNAIPIYFSTIWFLMAQAILHRKDIQGSYGIWPPKTRSRRSYHRQLFRGISLIRMTKVYARGADFSRIMDGYSFSRGKKIQAAHDMYARLYLLRML